MYRKELMNISKKYCRGFSLIELIMYVSLFSIGIVLVSSTSSFLYKGYKKFNVKQDSQTMYNLFKKQLKIDLMEVAADRVVIRNNGIDIRRDVWNGNLRQVTPNAQMVSYQNTCIPDNQGNNYPLIPAILRFNANSINNINNAINARMQNLLGAAPYIGCIGNTVPMIVRTETVNAVVVRTQFYPILNTGAENVNLSGTIAASMFVDNCDGGVRIRVLRASLNNSTAARVDIQEDPMECIPFNVFINILK